MLKIRRDIGGLHDFAQAFSENSEKVRERQDGLQITMKGFTMNYELLIAMAQELQIDLNSLTFDPCQQLVQCDATDRTGSGYLCEALNSDGEVELFELHSDVLMTWVTMEQAA